MKDMLTTLVGVANDASEFKTVGEALAAHDLDWTVSLRDTYYRTRSGDLAQNEGAFVVVNDSTDTVLGRVGSDYTTLNNAVALSHADALVEAGAATLDSVFSLKGGKRVGASLKLNEPMSIAGEDPIRLYITMLTSHDGSMATKAIITPVRLWCTNQLALSFKRARNEWSVRHLSKVNERMEQVREELEYVTEYRRQFENVGLQLVQTGITEQAVVNAAKESLSFMNEENLKKAVDEIFATWQTSELIGDDYKDTAWGAFNAITEWLDHHRTYRTPEARYNVITDGMGPKIRNNAAEYLLALAV